MITNLYLQLLVCLAFMFYGVILGMAIPEHWYTEYKNKKGKNNE